MIVYTIGFTKKSASLFFELIKQNHIELLLDIRLNNASQLAGFSKGSDLQYFLKVICGTEYFHCLEFAPTKRLLEDYKNKKISWLEYESGYNSLLDNRGAIDSFIEQFANFTRISLLCSEATAEHCHRRLLAEKIQEKFPSVEVVHL
jgi:uncharacterized protein (DUF488 family)